MNRNTWNVARFRFAATFGHRRNGLLALTVLVALLGGLAMGAVAAARSTQSSFPRLPGSDQDLPAVGGVGRVPPRSPRRRRRLQPDHDRQDRGAPARERRRQCDRHGRLPPRGRWEDQPPAAGLRDHLRQAAGRVRHRAQPAPGRARPPVQPVQPPPVPGRPGGGGQAAPAPGPVSHLRDLLERGALLAELRPPRRGRSPRLLPAWWASPTPPPPS